LNVATKLFYQATQNFLFLYKEKSNKMP